MLVCIMYSLKQSFNKNPTQQKSGPGMNFIKTNKGLSMFLNGFT